MPMSTSDTKAIAFLPSLTTKIDIGAEKFLNPINLNHDDQNSGLLFGGANKKQDDSKSPSGVDDKKGHYSQKSSRQEPARNNYQHEPSKREQLNFFDERIEFLDIRKSLKEDHLDQHGEFPKERPSSKSVPTTRVASADNSLTTSPIPHDVAPRRKADLAQYNNALYQQSRQNDSKLYPSKKPYAPYFNDKLFEEEDPDTRSFSNTFKQYLNISSEIEHFPALLSTSSAALDLATQPRCSTTYEPPKNSTEWPSSTSTHSLLSASAPGLRQSHYVGPLKKSASSNALTHSIPTSHERRKIDSVSEAHQPYIPKSSSAFFTSELRSSTYSSPQSTSLREPHGSESHYPDQLESNQPINSGICRFFQAGYCARGERCTFSHISSTVNSNRTFLPPFQLSGQVTYPPAVQPFAPAFYGIGGMMGAPFPYGHAYAGYGPGMSHGPFIRMPNGFNHGPKYGHKRCDHEGSRSSSANKYAGIPLEDLAGQIYALCKDQHGCRYLQKKLEEQNESYTSLIFNEVFAHFSELMTDPFGNYLCQKLLEHCSDDHRTAIVENVAPELVNISLNMHGTRAVQKMVEFLSHQHQIRIIVVALNPNVVTLIKDLNGNHVIQKCLNRLQPGDNQFIYNAVTQHCIEVATHRHGCCVLQRCIDHASESQKLQLVQEITYNALSLVQDPFGNYVVQYVLDLGDRAFSDVVIRRFIGNVCLLSVQKFSSNVMEKCIRVAEVETRKCLIEEFLNRERLEKLLRDSYANYVVQTALDYADPVQRAKLVECIRPLLPAIRNTPYGKRLQSKLHRDQIPTNEQMNQLNILSMGYSLHPSLNTALHFPTGGLVGLPNDRFSYNHYM